MSLHLIADSGSSKTEWVLLGANKKIRVRTEGLSPYFLNTGQIVKILGEKLIPRLGKIVIDQVHFFGTGCANKENKQIVIDALKTHFGKAKITVNHDLMGAAISLCGNEKGIACILGTGTNSCYYDGKKIKKNNPGLGYVLGDEGSGTHLGKKVLQYFLYDTFDEELMHDFKMTYQTSAAEILNKVYKQPLPNRYLAQFTMFLAQNRGHFMVENILEDNFHDFVYQNLYKYAESWKYPIHFTGSVAFHFKDVLASVMEAHGLILGKVTQSPMKGLEQHYS